MDEFGSRLSFLFRTMRKETGKRFLKKDLADMLGVSYKMINNYERGENKPEYDRLMKIADFFDVSLDFLCGKSDVIQRAEARDIERFKQAHNTSNEEAAGQD